MFRDPARFFYRTAVLSAAFLLPAVAWAQMGGPRPVRTTKAQEIEVSPLVRLSGSVQSRTASVVASEVAGLVEVFDARAGERVRKGAPIAHLRRQNLELRLAAAQAGLKEGRARLELATRNRTRSKELFSSGVISRQQFDDAVSESDAWQGRVDQLQAEIARLEDDVERSTIRAPFAGVVVAEYIQIGQWIDIGGPVVDLVDLALLEVVVDVPELHFGSLRLGGAATVTLAALPDLEIDGRISAVIPRADPQARTFPVKVQIENPDGRIGVGMLARVAFPAGAPRRATVVPKDALVRQGEAQLVYVVGEDNKVSPVSVTPGTAVGDWVAVEGAVRAGQQVVTRGNERLFPGQEVTTESLEYEVP